MVSQEMLKNLTAQPSIQVVDAMRKIDANTEGILFIVDADGKLIGCVTDGDIRRWLIRTGDLAAGVSQIMNRKPKSVRETERRNKRQVMRQWTIRALPVVDEKMRVVDVLFDEEKQRIGADSRTLSDVPVVMMAGGKGTRLYPYTKILPKPLIPIGDIPIAERIIQQFCTFGCREYHIIVNFKKNMIKAYFNEIDRDYEVFYEDEDEPLGTGGGLSLLKGKIDRTFILSNCDILIREDFAKMYAAHKEHGNVITMVCSLKSYPIPYGIVHLGEDGRLDTIEEKPQMSFLTNTGCYIVEPEVIEGLADGRAVGFPDIITEQQAAGKRVGIYPVSEQSWLDMGQMDTLEDMRRQLEGAAGEG